MSDEQTAALRALGQCRINVAAKFETWHRLLRTDFVGRELTVAGAELDHARHELERARDQVERIAVELAGGDVEVVCDGG